MTRTLKTGISVKISLVAVLLSGCASPTLLPNAGPNGNAILQSASLTTTSSQTVPVRYALLPVDQVLAEGLAGDMQGVSGLPRTSGDATQRIAVDDEVTVTVYEATGGGLFGSSTGGAGGTTLKTQRVDASGVITVPFASQPVRVLGLSPKDVGEAIREALEARAVEPQVIVEVKRGASGSASVVGSVARPATVPVPLSGLTILDAIAASGGVTSDAGDALVRLQRRGHVATTTYETLIARPQENVRLAPGDVVTVQRDERSVLVFGASGKSAPVHLSRTKSALADILANAEGLNDDKADPAALFVYRYEDAERLAALGHRIDGASGRTPVIYHVDLRNPAGYFLAGTFKVRDGDIVYVANASQVQINKFLDMLRTPISAANTGINAATSN